MSGWSLPVLLASLHEDIQTRLQTSRKAFAHPGTKGDASETVWLDLLNTYLPQRYRADKAFVVDSKGVFSEQIDVVVYDRQYSPFIFKYEGQTIVPAESIYAVFEAKQTINAEYVRYARQKVATVRGLHRTSLPVPFVGGTYPPKPLIPIIGGILTLDSDWKPCCGDPLWTAVGDDIAGNDRLDIGCVAAHGHFVWHADQSKYEFIEERKPATAFLLQLIAMLQFSGTVPMIDVKAYAAWLAK
jgi:hypothetical protein